MSNIACACCQPWDSVFRLAQIMLCIMTLHNFPPFVGPNVISNGPTNRLSIHQLSLTCQGVVTCVRKLLVVCRNRRLVIVKSEIRPQNSMCVLRNLTAPGITPTLQTFSCQNFFSNFMPKTNIFFMVNK